MKVNGTAVIQHVEVKIEGLGTFLTIATENHNSFRNIETMANSNLTAWWAQSKLALETQAITENEWITNLDMCSDLPDEISNTNRLKTSLALIQNSFQTSAEETAQEICRRLKRYLLEEFEAHLSKLRRSIRNTGDKDSLPFAPHRLEEATGRGMFEIDVRLPYSTRMQVEDLPDVCDRMLRQYLRTLSTSVKQFKDRISADAATLTSRQTIGLSMNQLHEMFEEFVKSVRLYRSGVLANNARRTAQEAGIVDTLAELEKAEITPAQRDGWLRQITSRVFPNWELGLADFKSKTGGLHERLAAEDHSIAIIRKKPVNYADSEVMAPEPNLDWLGTDSKVVKHLDDAVSEYAGLNDTFFSQLNTEYEETIANEREKLEEDIRQIRAVQKQRRLKFLAAPIFIAVIATVIYHLWGQESPNTWLADIFGGVAVVVFFGLASKVWDKTNAKIEKREKRHFRSSAEIAQRLLKDRAKMFRWSFVDAKKDLIKAEVSSKLSQLMQRYFLEVVTTPNLERYEETRKTATRIQSIANEYVAASKTLIEVLSGYYTQTETNLAVLAEVSSAIRAEAIEPSFERLKQRDEKLRSLRNELALIEPMATSAPAQ